MGLMEVETDVVQKTRGYLDKGVHKAWRMERERCEDLLKKSDEYKARVAMTKHDIAVILQKNLNQTTQWLVWAVGEGILNQYKHGSLVTYTAPAPWLHSPNWRKDHSFKGDVVICMGVISWI